MALEGGFSEKVPGNQSESNGGAAREVAKQVIQTVNEAAKELRGENPFNKKVNKHGNPIDYLDIDKEEVRKLAYELAAKKSIDPSEVMRHIRLVGGSDETQYDNQRLVLETE